MQQAWFARHDRRNSMGFRDVEHGQDGRPRLVVVGDSVAFGWGIERLEDRYGERLAALLGWESVNAAVPNTHTLDHIGFLEKVLPLKPRAVVLLYVFNDIDYLSRMTARRKIPLPFLFRHSHLYQQILVRFRDSFLVAYPDAYADDELLRQHAADLRRFTDLAKAHGAEAVIVPSPPIAPTPERVSRYLRLADAARRAGAPVWPIETAYAGYSRDELEVAPLDRHPNELAVRLAAEATAPFFQSAPADGEAVPDNGR
jgi:hypothetical protein